ncbi:hypothetical protein PAJ34TS1_12120 [Paenibacillus azoreducens]|uniref:Uncharacterized protein n=1 Tax=Paenibacillus azoreducens TaxID=116718 RepID=A0A920CWF9_9BACL|nr:hypothetical protein J34TS1_60930 [Paenibacillus azoreducens]
MAAMQIRTKNTLQTRSNDAIPGARKTLTDIAAAMQIRTKNTLQTRSNDAIPGARKTLTDTVAAIEGNFDHFDF